ncbi:MAG TPA: putative metal-binding motif-containing protein, partial [Polyangia bacterium]|nr:putative metal-binding motif-containing protein [Polyangia bacterium]
MAAFCLAAGVLGSGGCGNDVHLLELSVSADRRPLTLDIIVSDRGAGQQVLKMAGQTVPMQSGNGPFKVVVYFSSAGRYLVHLVGRPADPPLEIATGVWTVDDHVEASLHMVDLLPGMDADGDTFPACAPGVNPPVIECDCNDADGATNPAANDPCGDGLDQNCDGHDQPCIDADGDGVPACPPGVQSSPMNPCDCDDHDPNRFPGNREAPNSCPMYGSLPNPHCDDGIDQDCDGQDVHCKVDKDCDGFSPPADCDDNDATVHPGAPEICGNGKDDNCNGMIDEGCESCDVDGDGFFDSSRPECARMTPGGDCDDTDAGRSPSATMGCGSDPAADEGSPLCALRQLCNGRDDDCDGRVDEGCPPDNCDRDHDGFQNNSPGCNPPPGQVDCNDNDPHIFPGAPDYCGDGIAQNCVADQPCTADADHDHYNAGAGGDCDDNDPNVHPWATELCNGKDDDCDGLVDEGNPSMTGSPLAGITCFDDTQGICGEPSGAGKCVCSRVTPSGPVDPAHRVACPGESLAVVSSPRCFYSRHPDSCEQCDGRDHDCDGSRNVAVGSGCLVERDISPQPCGPNIGECRPGSVIGCNWDAPPNQSPFNAHFVCSSDFVGPRPEVCNGRDDDCNGQLPLEEQDLDRDHYMACTGCSGPLPSGLLGCGDCNDLNGAVYPGATEVCNGIDDNCDGQVDNGACSGATTCCAGLMACKDLNNDFNNCGNCGRACPSGSSDNCSGMQCHCGSGGVCGGLTDTCSSGTCNCGGGPACDSNVADRCSGGNCRCGGGPACGGGARCQSGNCVCNTSTGCSGCCQGGSCVSSTSTSQCGAGGSSCMSCNARSDTCNANGNCVCGSMGGPCSSTSSDNCSGGACHCGSGSPCGSGTRCSGGSCVCDTSTGCSGCCQGGNTCRSGTSATACGSGGQVCATCSGLSDTCNGSGNCVCGTMSGPCSGPLVDNCSGGQCRCGSSTCDPTKADNCSSGSCRCGSNPACTGGRTCTSG